MEEKAFELFELLWAKCLETKFASEICAADNRFSAIPDVNKPGKPRP